MATQHINRAPNWDFDPSNAPKEKVFEEFACRLQHFLKEKGWNQSQLGRQADIGRDSISGYIRGLHLPGPNALQQLSQALNCEVDKLLPAGSMPSAQLIPTFEIKQVGTNTGRCFLRVNQEVSMATAVKIMGLLNDDADD